MSTNKLPSLGFFGESPTSGLTIPIKNKITSLKIKNLSHEKSYINLKGVILKDESNKIIKPKFDWQISASSIHPSLPGGQANSLLECTSFHSMLETNSWWKTVFPAPEFVNSAIILNRPDYWGHRSAHIEISWTTEDGCTYTYSNQSAQHLLDTIQEISRINSELTLKTFLHPEQAKKNINEIILKNKLEIKEINWARLIEITNIWNPKEFNEDDLPILGGYLIKEQQNGHPMAFLAADKALLKKEHIKELKTIINKISEKNNLSLFTLTKHGLHPAHLINQKDDYIFALKSTISALEELSLSPILAYGTLLGAIRDNTFLEHDDDIDLLYQAPVGAENQIPEYLSSLKKTLEQLGYKCFLQRHGFNIHVTPPQSQATIDIFPYWVDNNAAYLHMEKMKIRPIKKEILRSRTYHEIFGALLPIPQNYVEFLSERYGTDWQTPNEFHEWPWQLEN